MRRRRQVLQVSTFPFLAVLLCAMGSLILLLLVIDRRAKVVMRAKALEAIRQMESEDEQDIAARQAEWERRCRALHEQLHQQKQELETKKASLEQQLSALINDIRSEQVRGTELDHQLQAEQGNLVQRQKAVASRLQETAEKKQLSESAQAELVRLTADLVKMEQTLEDLKALRQKQQQTYSLVPYRGRRGDNRHPLYLECAAESLIFHPDRWTLAATESSGLAILQEVERRINRRQSPGDAESGKKETPYLLHLVRPDGIVTYYRTLAALRNLKLDFGYEFVEPEWILNFPEDEKADGSQPWMAASPAPAADSIVSRRANPSAPSPTGTRVSEGSNRSAGSVSEARNRPGDPASGMSYRLGDRQQLAQKTGEPENGSNSASGKGLSAEFGYGHKKKRGLTGIGGIFDLPPDLDGGANEKPTGPGISPQGGAPNASSPRASGVTLGMAGPRGGSFASTSDPNRMGKVADSENGPRPGSELGGSPQNNPAPSPGINPVNGRGIYSPGSPPGEAQLFHREPIGERSSPMPGNAPANPLVKNDPSLAARGSGNSIFASDKSATATGGNSNGTARVGGVSAPSAPSIIPSVNALTSDSTGHSGSPENSSAGGSKREGSPMPQAGEAGPQLPGSSGLSQIGAAREKKSEPPPVVRRYVRRDWNIFIECKANEVVIYPGGSRIPLAGLAGSGKSNSRPLLQELQQMIARRQAAIASSEIEKNEQIQSPQIRFLVRPDGLRTYFLAFPELTALQLPMTRENLDADEDVARHIIGR
jgi:hypothetical protein